MEVEAVRWIASRGDSQTTRAIILTDSVSWVQNVKSGVIVNQANLGTLSKGTSEKLLSDGVVVSDANKREARVVKLLS